MFGNGIWWWLIVGGIALAIIFVLTGQTVV
jgi:hypothetical protein